MEDLLKQQPELKRPFSETVFACTAFNFGPRVITAPHRDHLNLAIGWCSITALGSFDATKGGHLVLPDLKLAVQFPAGATIFIPSATFTHYNLPIDSERHERRQTITQFSAGGIWRWISYGHQQKGVAVAEGFERDQWWEKGDGLYSIWPRDGGNAEDGDAGC